LAKVFEDQSRDEGKAFKKPSRKYVMFAILFTLKRT
jgi:hypothetical protein